LKKAVPQSAWYARARNAEPLSREGGTTEITAPTNAAEKIARNHPEGGFLIKLMINELPA
jgi:hypothetical protein